MQLSILMLCAKYQEAGLCVPEKNVTENFVTPTTKVIPIHVCRLRERRQATQSVCEKRRNNGYETHQTAFDSKIGHIGKLNCYIDHRIYEMLPFNVTVETPATTTCL